MEENRQTTVTMTDAEMAEFKAFQEAKKAEAAKAQAKQMREDYREMVDDAIESMMPKLKVVSKDLENYKRTVFENP